MPQLMTVYLSPTTRREGAEWVAIFRIGSHIRHITLTSPQTATPEEAEAEARTALEALR